MSTRSLSDEPVYVMHVAARMVGVHPQTLRLYERVGLVKPRRVNNCDHGNRLYSELDIERLKQIQRLTQGMGVNLAGVEIILNLLEQMDRIRCEAEQEMAEMRAQVEKMQHQLKG